MHFVNSKVWLIIVEPPWKRLDRSLMMPDVLSMIKAEKKLAWRTDGEWGRNGDVNLNSRSWWSYVTMWSNMTFFFFGFCHFTVVSHIENIVSARPEIGIFVFCQDGRQIWHETWSIIRNIILAIDDECIRILLTLTYEKCCSL